MRVPNNMTEENIRKQIFSKSGNCYNLLYENYSPYVYGQLNSLCAGSKEAGVLMHRVFEIAVLEIEKNSEVKGNLVVWLMNISRKVSRDTFLGIPTKVINDDRCIKRLVVSEGFSPKEAASILGINIDEAIVRLRKALKE